MTRTGTRRRRAAADAGNSTGVATAVLALLSASALATLGLVSAGEITGGLEGLGLGPDGAAVNPPGKVVVAGQKPTGPGGGPSGRNGSDRPSRGGPGPTVVPPLPPDITNDLPTPSGLDALPSLEPPPRPRLATVTPPAAPPVDPGVRVLAVHGRWASAPGHTKVELAGRNSAQGRGKATGRAGLGLPGGPVVLLAAAGTDETAGARPTAKAHPRKRVAPPQAAPAAEGGRKGTAPGRSGTAPGRAAERAAKASHSHLSNRPRPETAAPTPVVPTPAAALVTGALPGDPPGLAKGRADR